MARLALLAIGDQYAVPGPHSLDAALRTVAWWSRQDEGMVFEGVSDLLASGALWLDDFHRLDDDSPALWLSFVDGWANDWEDMLWRRCEPCPRPSIPAGMRQIVMERDGHRCRQCGTTERLSIDHIHPVSRGGLTVLHNLQVLCRRHNSAKHARVGVSA